MQLIKQKQSIKRILCFALLLIPCLFLFTACFGSDSSSISSSTAFSRTGIPRLNAGVVQSYQVNKDGSPKLDKKTGLQKIKTKYSKDIVNILVGHHNDYVIVGQMFNETQNYELAARAWGIYASLPSAEFLGDKKPELADSTVAQFRYYEGVMYFQARMHRTSRPDGNDLHR